jgi:glycosyltransferase involved in cell wall biosynthesis
MKNIDYSVIVPCLNEQESIEELFKRLSNVFQSMQSSFEIIFIDDGSTDNSWQIIENLSKAYPCVKGFSLRKNFGKSMAFSCGFEHATGGIVFTIDCDLQDNPEEIPKFIKKLNEGYDLVSGWKKKRNDPFHKVAASRIFNFFTSRLTGVKIHDFNCGFKAYRKKVIKSLDLYGDLFRFIPAIANWNGFKVGEVIIEHTSRKYSRSKYGPNRLVRGFFDLFTILFLTKYLKKPLHFFGTVGGIILAIGFGINIYLSVLWINHQVIGNRPLLILGILMMIVGIQFVSTGLLGEMIAHFQSKLTKQNFPIKETTVNTK